MTDNAVAKTIRTIGVCIIVIGVLGAFCAGGVFPAVTYSTTGRLDSAYNWGLVVAVIAGSIVSGSVFIALSEIIHLLQASVDKLNTIIGGGVSPTADKQHSVIKDIESNLPRI